MEPLLAVKVGCLVALLVLTLVCGLVPAQVQWFQIKAAKGRHQRLLNWVSCFAAGVFLGACLMHMVADAVTDIQGELRRAGAGWNRTGTQNGSAGADAAGVELDYPFAELVISLGFFLAFLTESLVLHCCRPAPAPAPGPEPAPAPLHSHGAPGPGGPSPASFRALVLFASLSLHSLFEGLAVGVQRGLGGALQLCLAVLAHKGVIAFSLGLRLGQGGTGPRWRLLYLGLFAITSPAGLAVGIGLSLAGGGGGGGGGGQAGGLAVALLEGVAAGTFLYVTFLEILPQELGSPQPPLAKLCFVALGFVLMALIAVWA